MHTFRLKAYFVTNYLISSKISKLCRKNKKSAITFLFLLVILGQPNFTDKDFQTPQKHLRRVKEVYVHPKYSRKHDGVKNLTKEQMPRYDFALLEAHKPMFDSHQKFNFKFEATVRPICLPASKQMRQSKFFNQLSTVSGYGRVEAIKIRGKHQTSMQLKQADLRIIGRKDKKCSKVNFDYI